MNSAYEFFTRRFMDLHSIHPEEGALVLDGCDFDPKMMGYTDPTSSCSSFLFFYLKRQTNFKPWHKVIVCRYFIGIRGEPCGHIFRDFYKFFNHLRTHVHEKLFHCPICRKPFSHKGNLTRHVKTIHGDR